MSDSVEVLLVFWTELMALRGLALAVLVLGFVSGMPSVALG